MPFDSLEERDQEPNRRRGDGTGLFWPFAGFALISFIIAAIAGEIIHRWVFGQL